jgi:hypothetical protein
MFFLEINPGMKEAPLIFSSSVSGDHYISFDDFEKVIDSINKGLARPYLLIKINEYKQIRDLMIYYSKCENLSDNDRKIQKLISTKIKDTGIELRNEIISGYDECIKKLGLKDNVSNLNRYYYKAE